MAQQREVTHVTGPVTAVADRLPEWVRLVRAPNPGPLTLAGTNTWVLRAPGAAAAVVVDPGPDLPTHLERVAGLGPVAGILLTHGHADHAGGLARFQRLTGAPVLPAADPGADPAPAAAGLRITALPTPGHTRDSVCFQVTAGGGPVVLTGDTILGRGTTVVAWPDGDLGDYLASLDRLRSLAGVAALPGHGPALVDCGAAAAYYLGHRRERLEQVRAALAAGATTPAAVVAATYPGLDPALRPAAELSVRAALAHLGTGSDSPEQTARESSPPPPRLDPP